MNLIDKLARDVNERLNSAEVSPETKRSVLDELDEGIGDFELFLEGEDGFEDVLLEHLQKERERFLAETDDEIPDYIDADGVRDEQLCTCRNSECDIKKGKIPVAVRKSESLRKGIRRFKQEHPGYPEALDAAAREYRQRRGRVHQRLRLVNAALGSDRPVDELRAPSEPPEHDEQPAAATD